MPSLDEAVGAVNLCRDFNVGHHVVLSSSGGSLRSSASISTRTSNPGVF
jgi:hypothetical protein